MFPASYFGARPFAPRYFPKVGAAPGAPQPAGVFRGYAPRVFRAPAPRAFRAYAPRTFRGP